MVPRVGDIVKMPSKWPGEYDVAQVDYVQFIGARGSYEVDLLPLKPVGNDMYRLPGRKPASVRSDVAKLGRLDAVYVREADSYRVDPASLLPIGGRKVERPSVTAQGLQEYAEAMLPKKADGTGRTVRVRVATATARARGRLQER